MEASGSLGTPVRARLPAVPDDISLSQITTILAGFFAIMNPLANTPIFLGMTSEMPKDVRNKVALRAVLAAFLIVATFTVAGHVLFNLFGITLTAFRITGGLLVVAVGHSLLHGETSKVHTPTESDQKDSLAAELSIAISPLAMPILAGPGTIATAMNLAAGGSIAHVIATVVGFLIVCFVTLLCFRSADTILRVLGQNGVNVAGRLMGLILAVIGIQMLIDGIRAAVAGS